MSAVPMRALDAAPLTPGPSLTALHGADAWMVVAGYVNVFASPAPSQPGAGRRYFLFSVPTGAIVFGLPASAAVVFEAIGTEATEVTAVSRDALDTQLAAAETSAAILRSVESWVDHLCEFMAPGVAPVDCMGCVAGQDAAPAAPGSVRPSAGVLGVEVAAGPAALFGEDVRFADGEIALLSVRAWLGVDAGSVLRWSTLEALAANGALLTALDALHRAAGAGVARRLSAIAAGERARYSTKMTAASGAVGSAFRMMAATFHAVPPEHAAPAVAVSTAHDQLNAACLLVATYLRIPLTRPPATSYRTFREGIENVTRASNFRARHVALTAAWWRGEQGPLVAVVKEGSRPVALLPRPRGGYDLVEPGVATPRKVDAALAATLAPTAVTFYRPFGAGAVDFLALMRFGIGGCGRELTMVVAAGALAGVIAMGIPIVTGILVNTIIPSTDRPQLAQWTAMLVLCAVAAAMFQVARSVALVRLEMKIGYSIQAAVWDRLISLPVRFFRDYSAGNLATRAMGIDSVRQTLSGVTIRGVLGGIFSVFNFALLFYYDAALAACATVLILSVCALFVAIAYLQRVEQREVVALQAKTSGVVLQLLTGIRKLRVAAAETRAFGIWARLHSERRRAQWRITTLGNTWKVISTTLPLFSYGVLFTAILFLSSDQSLRTGDFLAFMAAFSGCFASVLTMAMAAIGALSVVPQFKMARPILVASPEISPGQVEPGVLTGDIRVDRVVFGYHPEAPPVLKDISFHVKAGDFVAFVGPSGSGKSTILRLLLGFETPLSGAVSYDGRDFKDLDVRAVRRQIGVVLQSGRLMPGDIYTNIIGCSSATMDDAWRASRMSGFEDDLKRMPMGMHTMVSEGGATLSGGQRQRLMIARAIVTAPRMLFFDEATSALDNRTQAIVSQSLDQLRATRIVVAHRLSTIINADCIHVVEKGRIVQSGTYAELMAQAGPFRDLASRQLA